ncbi:MAG TPA: tetratricopeptide repeat protein [Bacteroidales bacterium]|nr:tetratricopeptide repeat protein [Bacteroidales bacterium]HQI69446.1 tetratricopeptide repeat protein [Bacteroidales bacterium]
MRKVNLLFSLLIGVLLIGCGQSKEKMLSDITEKEKPFFSNPPVTDTVKINEMVALYTRFADKFSNDSLAPVYLYRAASLQMNSGKNEEAIASLEKIIKDHSDFSKLPETYFLKAFIYDNNIKNLKKAREAYLDFIQKFPDNELADDAQISINNLGKTPEQIINEIQVKQKQHEDSLAAATKK